jgi:hypothetical protein
MFQSNIKFLHFVVADTETSPPTLPLVATIEEAHGGVTVEGNQSFVRTHDQRKDTPKTF